MYRHQTTCEPTPPSLGRRIDLSEYRDPKFLQNLPQPSSPVSMDQTTVMSSSPSSSLPPLALPEPSALSQPGAQPQITPSQTTVEVTTSVPPFDIVKKAPKRKCVVENCGETAKGCSARVGNTKCKKRRLIFRNCFLNTYHPG